MGQRGRGRGLRGVCALDESGLWIKMCKWAKVWGLCCAVLCCGVVWCGFFGASSSMLLLEGGLRTSSVQVGTGVWSILFYGVVWCVALSPHQDTFLYPCCEPNMQDGMQLL